MKRLVCILLICLLLWGCTPAEPSAQEYVFCMDTVMDLSVWGADSQEAVSRVAALLRELEDTWSASDPDSLLSALNSGEAVLTHDQQAFLDRVAALSLRTGGAFDPRLYALTSAWGFPDDAFRVPSQDEINAALEISLWDLGGAVKGYAGTLAAQLLAELDVSRAILNLGGNVQTFGEKADGTPWQIAVQDPFDPAGYVGLLSVTGTMAIVTSGDYQRNFEENGVTYHHILDPGTGYPADSGLRSVTVICRDGLTADALSTALFVMGLEEATQLWRASDDFEAVFITADGTVYATEGVVLSGCEFEVIRR